MSGIKPMLASRRDGSFNERDNCIISSLEVRFADGLSDFLPDPSWDLYQQTDTSDCRATGFTGSSTGTGTGIGTFSPSPGSSLKQF